MKKVGVGLRPVMANTSASHSSSALESNVGELAQDNRGRPSFNGGLAVGNEEVDMSTARCLMRIGRGERLIGGLLNVKLVGKEFCFLTTRFSIIIGLVCRPNSACFFKRNSSSNSRWISNSICASSSTIL